MISKKFNEQLLWTGFVVFGLLTAFSAVILAKTGGFLALFVIAAGIFLFLAGMLATALIVRNNVGFAFWILGKNEGYLRRELLEEVVGFRDWLNDMLDGK